MGRTFDTVYEEHRSTVCGEHLGGGGGKGGGKGGGGGGGEKRVRERDDRERGTK